MNTYGVVLISEIVFMILVLIARVATNIENNSETESTENTGVLPAQQYNTAETNTVSRKWFPFIWWSISGCMGGLVSCETLRNYGIDSNIAVIVAATIFALLISGVPMWVAWYRNIKRRKIVYTLAGLGVWVPIGIVLSIFALMWAIIGRRAK